MLERRKFILDTRKALEEEASKEPAGEEPLKPEEFKRSTKVINELPIGKKIDEMKESLEQRKNKGEQNARK